MDPILESLQQTQSIAMVVVLLLLFLWEGVHPFYEFFTGSTKDRGKHALRNLVIGGINALMIAIVFVGLWLVASVWAAEARFGLMHWMKSL